ncbi:MAG: hypothetical protein JWP87_6145 [Labilithrix sp.]|nr:hypothetical protein [Labilithrix sp.]
MTSHRSLFTHLLSIAFALFVATTSARARADEAAARQHFKRGVELYDRKQYQPALEEFRAAYAEKPSPGIKQNVALCLKGLGRPVEAATAFDEALDEGEGTLRPDVRAAMEQELTELSKVVATVRIKAIAAADKRPVEKARLTVDGTPLSPAAARRPIRLEPGIHVFTAHADGLADPPEKKLSLLAGSPVDATFELGALPGTLVIVPSVPDAIVQVDALDPRDTKPVKGAWTFELPPGPHHVIVSGPGYQTTMMDVVVSSAAKAEYPVSVLRPGELPPVYTAPARKPPPPQKTRYLVPMLSYEGQSMRLAPVLGERAGGTKRAFTGASGGVRLGYRASRSFALEIYGDVGQLTESYAITAAADQSTTKVIHWQVTPGVRFATVGPVRFTTAMGIGVHGLHVDADVYTKPGLTSVRTSHQGSGIGASWLVDMGMQFDVGSLFVEAVAFFDMHGVGSTRDDDTNERMLYSSPGTRAGVRIGLGISF